MANAFQALKQNSLQFQLTPVSIREFFFLQRTPCAVFALENGLFMEVIAEGTMINQELLKKFIQNKQIKFFVYEEDRQAVIDAHQESLIQLTRSLSMGDSKDKVRKQLNLLTVNMSHLYNDPTIDNNLNIQYQSVKNLSAFLIDNPELHPELFVEFQKQKHPYIFAQPLIASLFVIGLLRISHLFGPKDMEGLFVTSYFKDIGMSSIPAEKYYQKKLTKMDRKIFINHPKQSVNILDGRIPLSQSSFKIIENHHSFSILKNNSPESNERQIQIMTGVESMIVTVMDVVAAMISERPYRKAASLFEALELVKHLFADQHPQEFKLVVSYFKNFFSRM